MKPTFKHTDGHSFLMDEYGQPRLYANKIEAIWKVVALKANGYNAYMVKGEAFYRIAHKESEGVENPEVIGQTELS